MLKLEKQPCDREGKYWPLRMKRRERLVLNVTESVTHKDWPLRLKRRERLVLNVTESGTQRLASETEEEREARLQRMSQRLASETEEEREARLQRMRLHQQQRLASETEEEREARLQRVTLHQQERLASETEEEREDRIERDRERHTQQATNAQIPLCDQPSVRSKMSKFHSELVALQVSGCGTCSETFPGLNVTPISSDSNYTECVRCSRDKHIPKLYSSANNMDPGCVPPPLQVSITACVN